MREVCMYLDNNNNNNNNNIGTLKIESGWKPRLKKHVDIMLMLTVDNKIQYVLQV